ncbi:MAG: sporulation protein YabP [Ruminococcus sp.]|nr:sporulation protein YabP [Ruminococcus sp.]
MQNENLHHNAILEDRSRLLLTGVNDVESFDEKELRLYTKLGELTVRGSGLKVSELSTETGELSVSGDVSALIYGEKDRTRRVGVIGKLLR